MRVDELITSFTERIKEDMGVALTPDRDEELKTYARAQIDTLSTLVDQAGYERAVEATGDLILMRAMMLAYDEARETDERSRANVVEWLNLIARVIVTFAL